ncbi:MAG: sodium:proton exchanger, partial [Candidatus Omnitrophota bacterium]
DVKISLLLGAVASATAPAATVSVINQYRTKGILTTTILGVVAIDDGIALIIYIFVAGFVSSFLALGHLHFAKLIFLSLGKILSSLGLGLILGIMISYLGRKVREKRAFFSLTLGIFLLGEGLAINLGLSELLLIMSMAMMMSNLSPHRFISIMDYFEVVGFPIIAGFFCLAGTRLSISLFTKIGFLAIVYLFARFLGKYLGASLGASLSKAPELIRKYIGLALWPQIGVALALAIMVERNFGSLEGGEYLASLAINVLLFTTIITETVGPLATKYALSRAGEIRKFSFKQKGG